MRLVILALLLVLMLGCTQTVQPPANSTIPNNTIVPPANISVPNRTNVSTNESNITSNQTMNITVPSNQSENNTVTNQTMNMTVNSTLQGMIFDDGQYSLVLDDVSLMQTKPCGIFSIRNMNDSIVDEFVICPTQSQIWIDPNGHKFRIRADDIAAGYTKQTMWANVEIFG